MAKGIAREGFDLDLKRGKEGEYQVARAWYGKTEVKTDDKYCKTGNLFVEYAQKGRPSGIAVSTAEYWAFVVYPNRMVLIPTKDLRAIARRFYKIPGRNTKGGDNNLYDGVLVPMDAILGRWGPGR